jgi:hypothetical protein
MASLDKPLSSLLGESVSESPKGLPEYFKVTTLSYGDIVGPLDAPHGGDGPYRGFVIPDLSRGMWWKRPWCWITGHAWRVLRVNGPRHAVEHFQDHSHSISCWVDGLTGVDAVCDRCGMEWFDNPNLIGRPWWS